MRYTVNSDMIVDLKWYIWFIVAFIDWFDTKIMGKRDNWFANLYCGLWLHLTGVIPYNAHTRNKASD